jgi:hypothetical protein
MKKIKHFCVVFTLLFTLSINARSGEMPGAGVTAAPTTSVEGEGEMPGAGLIAPTTEIILRIVEGVLSTL